MTKSWLFTNKPKIPNKNQSESEWKWQYYKLWLDKKKTSKIDGMSPMVVENTTQKIWYQPVLDF